MSGEIIVVTLAFKALEIVGVNIAVSSCSMTLHAKIKESIQNAMDKVEKQDVLKTEWLKERNSKNQNIDHLRKQQQELQQIMSSVRLQEIENLGLDTSWMNQVATYFILKKEFNLQAASHLIGLNKELKVLSEKYGESATSPIPALSKRLVQLVEKTKTQNGLMPEEIYQFRSWMGTSIQHWLDELENLEHRQVELMNESALLMQDVMLWRSISENTPLWEQWNSLWENLEIWNNQPVLSGAKLSEYRDSYEQLKQKQQDWLNSESQEWVVADSLKMHLAELGYSCHTDFPARLNSDKMSARFLIPGGEYLDVNLYATGQMGFQVKHAGDKPESELDSESLDKFRRQENKWCEDARELFRLMAEEGIHCEITLEQNVPQSSIPIVIVETADELAEEEAARRSELKQRKMT